MRRVLFFLSSRMGRLAFAAESGMLGPARVKIRFPSGSVEAGGCMESRAVGSVLHLPCKKSVVSVFVDPVYGSQCKRADKSKGTLLHTCG